MSVGGELAAEWALIREGLLALDGSHRTVSVAPASLAEFAVHVLDNLRRQGESRTPMRFWIGNTGSGTTPNYEVEFGDGSSQAYHFSGAPHRVPSFDRAKLRGPFMLDVADTAGA